MTTLRRRALGAALAASAAAAAGFVAGPAVARAQEITLWSHCAAGQPKRQFVE
jgi:ABC-type glycerol-3-phosphate transport system substrate-binding protein